MGGRWSDRDIRPCTLAVMLLCLGLAAGRLSPDVSTAVFGGMKQHSLAPLAVLQTNHSGDDGTRPSLLKIFAEDPEWPSKVLIRSNHRRGKGTAGACNRFSSS